MLDVEIIPKGRDKQAAEAYKFLRWMLRRTRKEREEVVMNLAEKLLLRGHVTEREIESEVIRVMK